MIFAYIFTPEKYTISSIWFAQSQVDTGDICSQFFYYKMDTFIAWRQVRSWQIKQQKQSHRKKIRTAIPYLVEWLEQLQKECPCLIVDNQGKLNCTYLIKLIKNPSIILSLLITFI